MVENLWPFLISETLYEAPSTSHAAYGTGARFEWVRTPGILTGASTLVLGATNQR